MAVSPSDYIHPEDESALAQLKSVPLFGPALKLFMNVINEQFLHGMNMSQKIRLGPNQLPEIHAMLPPICEMLGIAEPELYLEMSADVNAYTQGDTAVSVTLTSALMESLEEDEVKAVLAHECGHIACHHVLYHTMADYFFQFGARIFGPLAALSAPLSLALMYWYRRSELSCDRAAALYMKGPQPVVDTLIRLAGGPRSVTAGVNVQAYLDQARAYDRLVESAWNNVLQNLAVMHHDHPFLAVRATEITKWCESDQFARLLEALKELAAGGSRCSSCGEINKAEWKFCRACGSRTALTPPKES